MEILTAILHGPHSLSAQRRDTQVFLGEPMRLMRPMAPGHVPRPTESILTPPEKATDSDLDGMGLPKPKPMCEECGECNADPELNIQGDDTLYCESCYDRERKRLFGECRCHLSPPCNYCTAGL